MSVQRVFHCDEKDCRLHTTSIHSRPQEPGWLFVTETRGRTLHFCCWDCLMKYASQFPPPKIIPVAQDVGED